VVLDILVPDIGELDEVDVVEVLVTEGDAVVGGDPVITLESDKASMDLPAPASGVVAEIAVRVGDKVTEGELVARLELAEAGTRPEESGGAEASRSEPGEPTLPTAEATRSQMATASTSESAPSVSEEHYDSDVLVLGSGPGGYTAAFRAADLGLRVVLVERYDTLGGVCLNVGCIPSKALLHLAEVLGEIEGLAEKGIEVGEPHIDLERMRAWKSGVVSRLTKGLAGMAERRGVRVVQGEGRFVDEHSLEVVGDDGPLRISFANAIVAAGSRATSIPGLPDDPRIWSSTRALELAEVPGRLLVIGAGVIGLEMATVFDALGSKVSVVEMLDRAMAGCDAELLKPLVRRVRRRYEGFWLATRVAEVRALETGLEVSFEGEKAPKSAVFDAVLVATGRRGNGDLIGLENLGLDADERGFVAVDSQQRTSVSHIFAIGDIAGEPMLAHKASHEGKVAAEVAAGGCAANEARAIPSVAYTDPEVAWVGLSEEEAQRSERKVEMGVFPWAASGRSLALGRHEGSTRLVFDPETRRLLGAGIVGPRAGDLIAEMALAIEMGADAEDLALTVHPHPTLAETLAQAAEVFAGTVTDLYLPRGRGAKAGG
jgi:dihydrolipoamide dehydrogenase